MLQIISKFIARVKKFSFIYNRREREKRWRQAWKVEEKSFWERRKKFREEKSEKKKLREEKSSWQKSEGDKKMREKVENAFLRSLVNFEKE